MDFMNTKWYANYMHLNTQDRLYIIIPYFIIEIKFSNHREKLEVLQLFLLFLLLHQKLCGKHLSLLGL